MSDGWDYLAVLEGGWEPKSKKAAEAPPSATFQAGQPASAQAAQAPEADDSNEQPSVQASRPLVTCQVEDYADCIAEIRRLLPLHWQEIALDHDAVPLDMDVPAYEALAAAGQLSIVTARRAGELVGYHVTIVRPHLHYASTLHGAVDVYWLRPDCRRGFAGVQLFRVAERALRARGVIKMISGTKLHKDMGRIFERLGWAEIERTFAKVLGD